MHPHTLFRGNDLCGEDDPIRKIPFDIEASVLASVPFELRQFDVLLRPHCGHVRVSQIGQTEIRPQSLRNIHDHVTRIVPRSEDADFRFALRIHGSIEEADTRMTATRIAKDQQW